jgi:hypothetical protein
MCASRQEVKSPSKTTPSNLGWDTPRFLLGDAAAASGIKPNVLKAWLAREIMDLGRHDLEASGKGSSRLMTLRTVLGIAVMAELVRLGLPPHRAAAPAKTSVTINIRDRKNKSAAPNTDCLLLVFPANMGKFIRQQDGVGPVPDLIFSFFTDRLSGQITDTIAYSVVPPDHKGSIHDIIKTARTFFTNSPASVATVSIPAVLEQVRHVLSARGKLDGAV